MLMYREEIGSVTHKARTQGMHVHARIKKFVGQLSASGWLPDAAIKPKHLYPVMLVTILSPLSQTHSVKPECDRARCT